MASSETSAEDKLHYLGYFSPHVLERIAEHMFENRFRQDGSVRPPDDWKSELTKEEFLESLLRHTVELWKIHEGELSDTPPLEDLETTLCAIVFNSMGYLYHELAGGKTKSKGPKR